MAESIALIIYKYDYDLFLKYNNNNNENKKNISNLYLEWRKKVLLKKAKEGKLIMNLV